MKVGKSMQELSESGELRTFFDRRLIKALSHPVREHILAVLNERVASGREIGEELGTDVSSFYHHIEQLEKLGCIERVETRRRRGANEHFFRAKRTIFFDDEAWQALPESLRADISASSLQALFDDMVSALESGAIDVREDRHVSWARGAFDAKGWEETKELMSQTLGRLGAIRKASAIRLSQGAASEIDATLGILAFETPKPGLGLNEKAAAPD